MKDFLAFLISKEAIIVYFVALLACVLCVIIYYVEKNNVKLRQRHNTRELNKLVSQIKEKTQETEDTISYEEPVLEQIVDEDKPIIIEEMSPVKATDNLIVDQGRTTLTIESPENEKPEEAKEEIKYTSIEPSEEEAQEELKRLTTELKKQSEIQPENIKLTKYEELQEENAIISLDELVSKSKSLYESNELSQYSDEGNVPISLQELEKKVGEKAVSYSEPFIIEDVIPKEDKIEIEQSTTLEKENFVVEQSLEKQVAVTSTKKFKNSPIISPIYGIEEESASDRAMELENTANYEKLDAEIKRTSEFLMTLKELQKRLD